MSSFVPVDDAALLDLLKTPTEKPNGYVAPARPQHGPLRRYDKGMSCAYSQEGTITKGRFSCKCPTNYRLNAIPTCTVHALMKMNEMLYELGVGT